MSVPAAKYTAEQRQWVIDRPDAPGWLIAESFREKFGIEISAEYVGALRRRAHGTTNARQRHGTKPARRLAYDMARVRQAEAE